MTSSALSRRRLLIAAPLLLPLASCATQPARVFTLVPWPPKQPRGRSVGVVVVKSVEIAGYLDRPQIVRYGDTYELKVSEFERWGEGMRDMVTRVLIEDLALRLPNGQVLAGSGQLSMQADATVATEISRFDADPGGAVTLAAQWVVHREKAKDTLHVERIGVATSTPATADLAAAMSDALGQLADRIALGLAT